MPTCKNITLVSAYPATPASISGPTELCPNGSGNYSTPVIPNADSYEWTASGGLTVTSGQGSTNVVITASSSFTNGTIKVKGVNCKGAGGYRAFNVTKGLGCRNGTEGISNRQSQYAPIETLTEINVYPNPTSGKASLTFTSANDATYSLKVYDLVGKVLISEDVDIITGFNQKDFNFENVAKGMYFVTLQAPDNASKTLRIIVE